MVFSYITDFQRILPVSEHDIYQKCCGRLVFCKPHDCYLAEFLGARLRCDDDALVEIWSQAEAELLRKDHKHLDQCIICYKKLEDFSWNCSPEVQPVINERRYQQLLDLAIQFHEELNHRCCWLELWPQRELAAKSATCLASCETCAARLYIDVKGCAVTIYVEAANSCEAYLQGLQVQLVNTGSSLSGVHVTSLTQLGMNT